MKWHDYGLLLIIGYFAADILYGRLKSPDRPDPNTPPLPVVEEMMWNPLKGLPLPTRKTSGDTILCVVRYRPDGTGVCK